MTLGMSGCLSFSRHNGAKVLEKGQVEVGLGLGARTPDDPALFPLPIPQGPVLARIGLGRDVDLGFKGYLLGSGFDLRYRFHRQGRWHVAVNPGVGFVVIPGLLNPAQIGSVEASMPLVAEVDANDWLSLSFGGHVTLRQNVSVGPDSTVARFDLYSGLGGRAEGRFGLFAFGVAVDGVFAPTRFTNVPSAVLAFDVRIRTRTAAEAKARQEKRAARKARKSSAHLPALPVLESVQARRTHTASVGRESERRASDRSGGPPSLRSRWVPRRVRWARWVRTDQSARLDDAFGVSGRSGWAPSDERPRK
jgi:hypothetical protein